MRLMRQNASLSLVGSYVLLETEIDIVGGPRSDQRCYAHVCAYCQLTYSIDGGEISAVHKVDINRPILIYEQN